MSNTNKTIIFVSNEPKLFGAPKVLLNIINYFHSTQKYKILVVCPADGPLKTVLVKNGIKTITPTCLRSYYFHISQPGHFLIKLIHRAYDNLKLLLYFTRFLLKFPDRIIYANTSVVRYIALPALLSRTKLVWHIHEYFPNPIKQKFHSTLIGYSAEKIILSSPNLLSRLALSKRAQEKVFSLHYLPALDPKNNLLIAPDHPCYDLMFAGRISIEKGVLDLLKSINNYLKIRDKIKVFIIGLFVEKDKKIIMDYIVNNNLAKYITLHEFDPEIDQYILNTRVVVLPSYRESFGLILLEAVMLEKPIIGTDVGSVRNLITHNKNGIIVDPGDIEELTNAIDKILDAKAYTRFVAGARDKKKEILSNKSNYKELEELIDSFMHL